MLPGSPKKRPPLQLTTALLRRRLGVALGLLLGPMLQAGACGPDEPPTAEKPQAAVAQTAEREPAAPSYVGAALCRDCHAETYDAWKGSHHDQAMAVASRATVLGDFDNTSVSHFGLVSRFQQTEDAFLVSTDGPLGTSETFEVTHTFGVTPLQQYLIETAPGRFQALPLAWDTRPATAGGQRWFHLYPDQALPQDDPLHWTGPAQNWNHVCAECHSTNLKKRYNAADKRFETSFDAINVSCEACHGPASAHLSWAESAPRAPASRKPDDVGLRGFSAAEGSEIDTCGRCHSRRSALTEEYEPSAALADTHRLALLDEGLYHPDGQILGEVYVYGSFLQSAMHREGVVCSDCHDPHSAGLRREGNALCTGCHAGSDFDTPDHHFHQAGKQGQRQADQDGTLCVNCHMPETTYMLVDPRRDHSLRVPRPDLTVKIGTPNACNDCHADQSPEWASQQVETWYGRQRPAELHWGEAIQAGRHYLAEAPGKLGTALEDPATPGIAKATMLALSGRYGGARLQNLLRSGLDNPDPLVRRGAIQGLSALADLTLEDRTSALLPLLADPMLSVRLETARELSALGGQTLGSGERAALARALDAYRTARELDRDRAEGQTDLAGLAAGLGDRQGALSHYREALQLDPSFVAATLNMADLHRANGDEDEARRLLEAKVAASPDNGDARFALGLAKVRSQELEGAIHELRLAAELRPTTPHYAYVLAVALHSGGEAPEALKVLRNASKTFPSHPALRAFLAQLEAEIAPQLQPGASTD